MVGYRWIPTTIHDRQPFRRASRDARLLWLTLATSDLRTSIPGVVRAYTAQIEARHDIPGGLVWPLAEQLRRLGLVRVDIEFGLWLLPDLVGAARGLRAATIRRWRRDWVLVPECPLREEIREHITEWIRSEYPTLIDDAVSTLSLPSAVWAG